MPFLRVKNNAEGVLAGGINAGATSLTVATGEGAKFPADNFHISIDDEILLCTSRSGDVFTVQRGKEGTQAAAHGAGAKVQLRWTAAYVEELQSAIEQLQGTVQALQGLLAEKSCCVTRSTPQSIPNGTLTAVQWDAEEWDTDNIHSTTENITRLTCRTAGRYLVWYQVVFGDNTTGGRLAHVRMNGSEQQYIAQYALEKDPYGRWRMLATTVINLTAGDYIELVVYQASGAALNIGVPGTRFGMMRLPFQT